MKNFKVSGVRTKTGRKSTRTYTAKSAEAAQQMANSDGLTPISCEELPPEPPSERQLDYAKSLKINFPSDVTRDELSNLITIVTTKDKPVTEKYRGFAKIFNVECPRYIGKKQLFKDINYALISKGREKEMVSWFAFRIYRSLVRGSDNAPLKSPTDSVFQDLALEFESDTQVINSIRRHEGETLIWFGEFTDKEGWTHQNGASKNTIAYKKISSSLRTKIGAHDVSNKPAYSPRPTVTNQPTRMKNEPQGGDKIVKTIFALMFAIFLLYLAL